MDKLLVNFDVFIAGVKMMAAIRINVKWFMDKFKGSIQSLYATL